MFVTIILLCHVLLVNQKLFMTEEFKSMNGKEDRYKGEIDDYLLFQAALDENEIQLLEMLQFLDQISKKFKTKVDWKLKLKNIIEMLLNLKGEVRNTRNICGIIIYIIMLYLCAKQIKKLLIGDFEYEWRSFEDDSDEDSSEAEWDSSDTESDSDNDDSDVEDFRQTFARHYYTHLQDISYMNRSIAAGAA